MLEEILKILPERIAMRIKTVNSTLGINEIRLRVGKKIVIISSNTELFLSYVVTLQDLLDILINVSKSSIYAIQNDINNGFIVIKGGHRIGVCGEVVIQDFKVKNIKNINSMNIRVARQIVGCADSIMLHLIKDSKFTNTLIMSPPRMWKNYNIKRYYKASK